MTLVDAIARQEGWLNPRSRCRRNNNPGNIEYGKFARAHGAIKTDGRFAVFPTPEAGFAALRALLAGPVYQGLTVAETIAKYAPANENDTALYVQRVCLWSGCLPSDLVAPLVTSA